MPLKKNFRQLLFWFLAFTLFVAVYQNMKGVEREKQIPYSEFKAKLRDKAIAKVSVRQDLIRGEVKEGEKTVAFRTIPLSDPKLIEDMEAAGVGNFAAEADRSWIATLILNVGWIVLFIFLWWFLFIRQAQMGGKQAMAFGKSKAKQQDMKKQKVTFKDVAGCDETKDELRDIVDYLKNPKKYQTLGGELPKGVLLYGPPGTGKTLLARAVAGEAGVPFFTSSGSEFVEMFVGVGASRVRDLFERAKKSAPAIIFLDELDAVGRSRFAGIGGGHDEREQTLNQMLVELDGFESKEGIILIGATNRPDVLDTALLRPGRFDRRINVPVPDIKGRLDILNVHTKKVKLTEGVDLGVIARHTPGFTGADLANIVNEAAILAAKKEQKSVDLKDLEEAIEKNIAGPQRKSRIISESEKRVVAYHEAGHTLVAKMLPGCDPVHKVTIIPRGPALGYTLQMPLEDKYLTSKTEILNRLCVLLGGRAAEEIAIGEITTGAHDDLAKVSAYAHKMVLEFGMSEKIGQLSLKKEDSEVFLGRDIMRQAGYSNETARIVDEEIKRIVSDAYMKAKAALTGNRRALDAIANKLIENEVVDAAEIDSLIAEAKAAKAA
ncbi:MAG: cell division protein FtsH [Elusimicrobia bacterium GWA2_62_23]|nr:MAG: cell division protein FtsH [Elusimicrobia bacterium GWA2_62_23]OGR72387.1 MAG: cell division protein FtsH [Elusimicrobia bacterium GWC2_63_65]